LATKNIIRTIVVALIDACAWRGCFFILQALDQLQYSTNKLYLVHTYFSRLQYTLKLDLFRNHFFCTVNRK
jgi:hypothetical protein